MVEGIQKFINKDYVQALVSMGEAWRLTFNDTVEQVQSQYKEKCTFLEVA